MSDTTPEVTDLDDFVADYVRTPAEWIVWQHVTEAGRPHWQTIAYFPVYVMAEQYVRWIQQAWEPRHRDLKIERIPE